MKRINENLFSSLTQQFETTEEEALHQSMLNNNMTGFKTFEESYEEDIHVDDFFSFSADKRQNIKEDAHDNEQSDQQDFSRKSTTDTACYVKSSEKPILTKQSQNDLKEVTKKQSINPFKVIKPCNEETSNAKNKEDQTEVMSSDLSMMKSMSGLNSHEIVKYKNRLAAKKHRVKKASYYKILEEENKLLKKILQGTFGNTDLNKIIKTQMGSNNSSDYLGNAQSNYASSARHVRKSQHKKYENNTILPLNENLNINNKLKNKNKGLDNSTGDIRKDRSKNYLNNPDNRQGVYINEFNPRKNDHLVNMPLSNLLRSDINDTPNSNFNRNNLPFYLTQHNEYNDFNEDSSFNNMEGLELNNFDSLADTSDLSLLGQKRYLNNEKENDTHTLLDNLNKPISFEDLEAFGKFGEKKPLGIFNYDYNYKKPNGYSNSNEANFSGFGGLSQINNINNISICPSIADSCLIRQTCCSNNLKSCCCHANQPKAFYSNTNTKAKSCRNAEDENPKKQSKARKGLTTPSSKRKSSRHSEDSVSLFPSNMNNAEEETENMKTTKKKQKSVGKLLVKANEMKLKGQKNNDLDEKFSTISNDKVFSCLLEAKKEAIKTFLSKELSMPMSFLTENTTQGNSQNNLLAEELNNCLVQNFLKRISTCSK
jgi:hypothetical protein